MTTPPTIPGSADTALLEEMISEARSRLQVQLTVALAADQRAMSFGGLLLAGTAVLVGLAFNKDSTAGHPIELSLMAAGLVLSASLAFWSARPVKWHQAGNFPSSFSDDLGLGLTFPQTRIETAANYEKLLRENENTLQANAGFMKASLIIALMASASGIGAAVL